MKKVYSITWNHIKDQTLQIDYVSADSPNLAIIAKLGKILLDSEDSHSIAKNAPREGLAALIRYLEQYNLNVAVRPAPGYEEVSRGHLTYLRGDATYPQTDKSCVIPHICNDIGAWGSGFVIAVSNRWPEPEELYLQAYEAGKLKQGFTQFVRVGEGLAVFNMVAQSGVRMKGNPTPISYDSVRSCLGDLCRIAKKENLEVHMPKIGSARAGGNWRIIEEIIIEQLVDKGLKVFVYEFEE